jgi:NAD(P)H-hydrate repair Nnr-like enzyme with NAD(P)H-hydrate epimerase domain
MDMINRSGAKKVAVDVPSGLDPGSGAASRHTVRADVTVTFHRPKVGLRGREGYTGQVVVAPIGIGE